MDLIKKLETPEAKSIMQEIVKEKIEKQKIKNSKIKVLMANTNYINWLISFTKDNKGFTDGDWDYSVEKLNDSDRENVYNLELLFEGIYSYAKENYIYSLPCAFGEYYRIKMDNIGFEIGYLTGQGTMFYCKRIPLNFDDQFIDFMDIVNNKKQDNVDYIKENLENLSSLIIELYNKGIPIDAINEVFNRTMKTIIANEREKVENDKYKILIK